jgi:outer membrane protein assembly factor BamB
MRVGSSLAPALSLLLAAACDDLFGSGKADAPRQWIEWKTPAGRAGMNTSFGAPAVDDQRIYLGTETGLMAFDRRTGGVLWRSLIDRWQLLNEPMVHGGTLLVVPGQLSPTYAIDTGTGAVRWRRDDRAQLGLHYAQSAADDRAWYVGSNELRVLALNPANGEARWETAISSGWQANSLMRGLSVSGDTVYAAASRCLNTNCYEVTGVIVALDRLTGAELWRWEGAGNQNDVSEAVTVVGRFLLGGDRIDNTFFAVDRFTGREVWRVRGERGFVGPYNSPAVSGNVVYAGMGDTRVYAADLETGRVLWSTRTGGSIIDVAVCGEYLVVHNQDLLVLDRRTGKVAGRPFPSGPDEFTVTDIAVHGNRAYIGGNRYLYSIRCD